MTTRNEFELADKDFEKIASLVDRFVGSSEKYTSPSMSLSLLLFSSTEVVVSPLEIVVNFEEDASPLGAVMPYRNCFE